MSVFADVSRRTRIIVGLGAASVLGGIAALSFGPLVRARIAAVAERRGFTVEVGAVRVGMGAIWLRHLELSASRMPGVKARVDSARVGVSWLFDVADVSVHGATIELQGDADELEKQYAEYNEEHTAGSGKRAPTRYSADGVQISWRPRPELTKAQIWGLRYERDGARERVALDLARLGDGGIAVEARHPEALFRRAQDERQLEHLQAEGLDLGVHLESSPQVAGPAAPAKIAPFHEEPLRGAKVRAALAQLSSLAGRALPEGAELDLDGVRLRLSRGDDTLNVGPSTFRVARAGQEVDLSLLPNAEASGTPLELKLSLPIAGGAVRAEVRGGPVSLHSLGIRERDFGLSNVADATLQASVEVTLAPDGSDLGFSGSGVLDRVALLRPELSSLPLSGIRLSFKGSGSTTLDGSKLTIDAGEVALGDVRLQGTGLLTRTEHRLQTHWAGGVPLGSCQALLDSTPRGLAPLIAPLRMAGTFAVNAELDYDSERPSDTRVHLDVANDCKIGQIPAELSPHRFEAPWQREVKGADRLPMEIESGPGSPDWVPDDAISPFMETAVQVCEDGRFLHHHGFDYEAIENSMRDNLVKGRFVRGASTVSMQLAKNLYLSKEKTLGRKLQEAVLTLLLEQELGKRELMELYLNVIEYGPGIYGIGPAARYYFAKKPSELSLAQALYIASILPNPEHQHFDRDGRVSAAWTKYLQRLMHIARKLGWVTEEQLAVGLGEQVAFHVADSGEGAQPPAAPTVEEGTDTPSELAP